MTAHSGSFVEAQSLKFWTIGEKKLDPQGGGGVGILPLQRTVSNELWTNIHTPDSSTLVTPDGEMTLER